MIGIHINAKGLQETVRNLNKFLPILQAEVWQATKECGKKVLEAVQQEFVSGAPSKAPHGLRRTDLMYKSIGIKMRGKYRVSIGIHDMVMYNEGRKKGERSTARVAAWHEEGTKRMRARPFFGPAETKIEPWVRQRYDQAIQRAIASCNLGGGKRASGRR